MRAAREHDKPERGFSFWPREHGAYVQLLAPMLCALLFGRPGGAALAVAAAGCCAFLAHEPLLVWLGRRGARAREQHGRAAVARLGALVALGAALAAYACGQSFEIARAALVPGALSAAAFLILLAGKERTLAGELLSAGALVSFTVPLLTASQRALGAALWFAAGWLTVHFAATCAARAYVYRKRDKERALRTTALALALVTLLSGALYLTGVVPLAWALALSPFLLLTALLATGALKFKGPKPLGWVLTAANLIALISFGLSLQ